MSHLISIEVDNVTAEKAAKALWNLSKRSKHWHAALTVLETAILEALASDDAEE